MAWEHMGVELMLEKKIVWMGKPVVEALLEQMQR